MTKLIFQFFTFLLLPILVAFFCAPGAQAQSTTELKVMTYNIHFDNKGGEMESLASYLKNNAIDVVALQEVSSVRDSDNDNADYDADRELKEELDRIGYSMNFHRLDTLKEEQGSWERWHYRLILSRYPIASASSVAKQRGVWGFQTITINHPTIGVVRFIDTHPIPQHICSGQSSYCPDQAVYEMLDYAATFSEKKILLGDFNRTPQTASFQRLLEKYDNTCLVTEWIGTFCLDILIDNILYEKNRGFIRKSNHLDLDYRWSDHVPYIATFTSVPLPTPNPANPPPKGYLGLNTDSCEKIQGWTCDPSDYARKIDVHVYGPSGIIGGVTANLVRGDDDAIAAQCGGYGGHRFEVPVPDNLKTGQPVEIRAYAINYPAGPNPQLTNSPKTITCAPNTPTPTRTPTPTSIPLSGDTNGNRIIELSEWLSLFRLFYQSGSFTQGDADGNGKINAIDFVTIRRALGQ